MSLELSPRIAGGMKQNSARLSRENRSRWKLQHASFKGIRPREDEAAVFQLSEGIEE
jgi:hypothetical protein